MGFFRYALLDLVRGRRRTFSSILGILLAITPLSATFIAIDSSARATLAGMLRDLPGDLSVEAVGDPLALQADLAGHPGVVDAVVYVSFYSYPSLEALRSEGDESGPVRRSFGLFAVNPDELPRWMEDLRSDGPLKLPQGTVAISQGLASGVGVGAGEELTVRLIVGYEFYDEIPDVPIYAWLNLSVEAVVSLPEPTRSCLEVCPGSHFALIWLQDLDWFLEQLSLPPGCCGHIGGEVWIDRDRFINPYDAEGSERNLVRLERELETALSEYHAQVDENVSPILEQYPSQVGMQRFLYLLVSLPVLLLGLYLGAVGVDLGHAERRRELAVLRARGARKRQVMGFLLLLAVLGGILAAVLGLLAGVGLSRLLLTMVNPVAIEVSPSYGDVVLSVNTVVIVALFSVLFMLAASYRSAKRTAGLPVAQTLRHYAPGETRIEYRPALDVVLVVLGYLTFAGTLYAATAPGNVVTFLAGDLFPVLLPIGPALLIVGLTRLLTRSTGKIYEWVSRLWKPFLGALHHLVSRNLARNPRRASNMAVIIALGLAFGLFVFAFFGSLSAHQARVLRAEIGADASVTSLPADYETFAAEVADLEGVDGVSVVRPLTVRVVLGRTHTLYAVDPTVHFAVTQPESWYFDGLTAGEAQTVLRTTGQVLASRAVADELFLDVGDTLTFTSPRWNDTAKDFDTFTLDLAVGGIVRALPGTVSNTFDLPRAFYAGIDTVESWFAFPEDDPPLEFREPHVLVDLDPNVEWRATVAEIQSLGASSVRVAELEEERRLSNPSFQSILGFIGIEIAFIVVVLTAGLGLILFSAALERDVEFASVRARGATGWQAAGILLGEASAIMVIGLAIGTAVGLLVAYYLLRVFATGPFGPTETLVPLLFTVPAEGFLLVALAPAAMLLTALLIALRIARMNVARALKIRGG